MKRPSQSLQAGELEKESFPKLALTDRGRLPFADERYWKECQRARCLSPAAGKQHSMESHDCSLIKGIVTGEGKAIKLVSVEVSHLSIVLGTYKSKGGGEGGGPHVQRRIQDGGKEEETRRA